MSFLFLLMQNFNSIQSIRQKVGALKKDGKTIGFVPTMGALHEGHLSLIDLAKEKADEVIVSIYVNPEQFGPDEDFGEYPRSLEADLRKCEQRGVSAAFTPDNAMMYGGEQFLKIEIETLNEHMDGGSRPGFFEGIVLVVNKLFNIIEPNVAVFGQKDIQQFRILQQMVDEFNHDVELVRGPIVRAEDGLALSSRNVYLNEEQRRKAPGLYRCLRYIQQQVEEGVTNLDLLLKHQRSELKAKKFKIDYLNLFSFDEIAPVDELQTDNKYILAGAVYLGETRLIDNIIIET